jgi:transposase
MWTLRNEPFDARPLVRDPAAISDSSRSTARRWGRFHRGERPVLVWDELSAHWSRTMRAWVAEQDWLTQERLPAYAPELNPVELLWSSLKKRDPGSVRRGRRPREGRHRPAHPGPQVHHRCRFHPCPRLGGRSMAAGGLADPPPRRLRTRGSPGWRRRHVAVSESRPVAGHWGHPAGPHEQLDRRCQSERHQLRQLQAIHGSLGGDKVAAGRPYGGRARTTGDGRSGAHRGGGVDDSTPEMTPPGCSGRGPDRPRHVPAFASLR